MDLKKLFSGIAVSALAVAGVASASNFVDTQGHWAETEGYIDAAIAEGAIDGTKTSFRPNDNITRAELTKMVSVYDLGGDEPTAMDYLSDAGFSDVASDAWFYDTVNYAAEEGIVGGYSDGTFRPGVAMNRAEAVKVITLALEVPSVDVTLPFSDVASDAWFYPFVKNAYGNCVVKGRTATMFQPAENITRAEAVKVFVKSINPSCGDMATPTPSMDVTPAPTDGTTTPTPAVTTDATSDVVLSSMSPAAQSIPKNAYQVPFLAIDITASNDEDLLLTGLTLQHTGLGSADDVQNVQVFEGVIPRGNDKNFSGEDDVATLNLSSDPVTVPAGTTKTVYVRADMIDNGETAGEHAMALLNADSVTLVGATTGAMVPTSGTFPIVGATMSVANIAVGEVTVTRETVADNFVEAGSTDVEIGVFNIDAGSQEDVYVRSFTFEVEGGADDGDLENFYVEVDGVRVSDVVASATNDFVTFDLTSVTAEGILIEDSSDENFYVMADLTGPIDTFSNDVNTVTSGVVITMDDTSDIVVMGAKYGFGVKRTLDATAGREVSSIPSDTDTSSTTAGSAYQNAYGVVITGGDITFSLESEATDVAEDTDGIVFGTLTIENMAEAIEIDGDSYMFWLTADDVASLSDLENIKLVSSSGSTVLGPVDITVPAGTTSTTIGISGFSDDLYVAAGTTATYYIVADTKDNLTEDSTYKFTLAGDSSSTDPLSNVMVTGQTSDATTGFDIKPSGVVTTKAFTLKEAGITVTKKALQTDTYVAGTTDAVLWNGTIKADDVKDILIDRLTFDKNAGSTAGTSEINGFSVQAFIDGAWVDLEAGVSSNTPVTFSDLEVSAGQNFTIEAGEEVEIRVTADIADEVSVLKTIQLALTQTIVKEMESDGSIGDTITDTSYTAANYEAVAFNLVDAGAMTVALDSAESPNSSLLVAGTSDNAVAVYEFKADNEDVKVEDLTVEVVENAKQYITSTSVNSTVSVATTQTATTQYVEENTVFEIQSLPVGSVIKVVSDVDNSNSVTAGDTTIIAYEVQGNEGGLSGIASVLGAAIAAADSNLSVETLGKQITVYEKVSDTPAVTNSSDSLNGAEIAIEIDYNGDGDYVDADDTSATAALVATLVENDNGNTDTTQISTITVGGSPASTDTYTVTITDGGANTVTVTATGVAANTASTAAAIEAAIDAAAPIAIANGSIAAADVTTSGSTVTIKSTDTTADGNLATFSVSVSSTGNTAADAIANDADAVKSVSLYDGATLLDTVTLNTSHKAVFENLGWVVAAGDTKELTVKVNLNNIGTNASDTAESGHTFTTSLDVVEVKGNESGEVLSVSDPSASAAYFAVVNNKLQVAKSTQNTTLSGGNADLLKFKVFDASGDSDNAQLSLMAFELTATGPGTVKLEGADTALDGVDGDADDATYELAGGDAVVTCTQDNPATAAAETLMGTSGSIYCPLTDEISTSGTTFVLRVTGVDGLTTDNTVTTKLVINSSDQGDLATTPTAPTYTDGIVWIDGGNGDATTANGSFINWIDFGEADETTSYILNTVSN